MPRRIAILEDHPLMREFLHDSLLAGVDGCQVVYSGADVHEALAHAGRGEGSTARGIDLVLLDLDLGDQHGAQENVPPFVKRGAQVLVISAAASPEVVQQAMAAGAIGFMPKHGNLVGLVDVVVAALEHASCMTPELAGKLAVPAIAEVVLSDRQQRALTLFGAGMSVRAIAASMGLTTSDVDALLESSVRAYRKRP